MAAAPTTISSRADRDREGQRRRGPRHAKHSSAARFTCPGGLRPHPTRRTGPDAQAGGVGAPHPVAVVVGEVRADLEEQRHQRRPPAARHAMMSPSVGRAGGADRHGDDRGGQRAGAGSGEPRPPAGGQRTFGGRRPWAPSLPDRLLRCHRGRLVVVEAVGPAFVDALQRAWDAGDAVLPARPPAARPRPRRGARRRPGWTDDVEPATRSSSPPAGPTAPPRPSCSPTTRCAASAEATSTAPRRSTPSSDRWLACLPLAHVGRPVRRHPCAPHRHRAHRPRPLRRRGRRAGAGRGGCTRTSLVPTALGPDRRRPRGARSSSAARPPPPDRPANVIATYGMTETGSGIVYDGVPLAGVEVRVDATASSCCGDRCCSAATATAPTRDAPTGGSPPATSASSSTDGSTCTAAAGTSSSPAARTCGRPRWSGRWRARPAVAEVAVVGATRPGVGSRGWSPSWSRADPAAPPSLDALRGHVKAALPAYAAPRELELVKALPRTAAARSAAATLAGERPSRSSGARHSRRPRGSPSQERPRPHERRRPPCLAVSSIGAIDRAPASLEAVLRRGPGTFLRAAPEPWTTKARRNASARGRRRSSPHPADPRTPRAPPRRPRRRHPAQRARTVPPACCRAGRYWTGQPRDARCRPARRR